MSQKGCCDCRSASNRITQLLVVLSSIVCMIKSQQRLLLLNIVLAPNLQGFFFFCQFIIAYPPSRLPLLKCHPSFLLQLVKLCIGMIDAGKAYNAANKQFVSGIRELAQQSTKDEVIEVNK